ncbi:RNA polymerase sigma factor [Candidatus Uhrbacteria bacterium]|jgi:RNA polymerase sigma-70 factor, ECF subfamily|nr:RNA polymerase sigma factor [Candidatus Uhrbacteria bacterium]MBT7717410.1 RNA polymerase sigma factor [Candidatus Uhrbacteria bacterium]
MGCDKLSDQELAARACRGDKVAFRYIYIRYVDLVHRRVRIHIWDSTLVDDVVQEVFLKVYRWIGRYDPGQSMAAWISRIARNTAIDHLRVHRRITDAIVSVDCIESTTTCPNQSPEKRAQVREELAKVLRAIGQLTITRREILLLHVVEGLNHREVAELRGVSLGHALSTTCRARQQLRVLLADELE